MIVLLFVGIAEQDFAPLRSGERFLALALGVIPLILRRRFPFTAAWLMYAGASWLILQGGVPAAAQVSTLLGLFTLGQVHPTRRAITLQLLVVSPFLVTVVVNMMREPMNQFTILIVFALFTTVTIVLSEMSKSRADDQSNLERRAAELERAQRNLLRLAIEDERASIARELHDVVAHNVSVMVLQAGAAKRVLATEPGDAVAALAAIEESGRTALNEMRLVVGVLRPDADQGLEPQPVLSRLDELLSRVEEAGLPVTLTVEGEAKELPVALELSAYRIIQESLTNTLKHGGTGATAQVNLTYGFDDLTVEVLDTGDGSGDPGLQTAPEGGHGLVGIKERVALFGGTFTAGEMSGGGFVVRAELPLGYTR